MTYNENTGNKYFKEGRAGNLANDFFRYNQIARSLICT